MGEGGGSRGVSRDPAPLRTPNRDTKRLPFKFQPLGWRYTKSVNRHLAILFLVSYWAQRSAQWPRRATLSLTIRGLRHGKPTAQTSSSMISSFRVDRLVVYNETVSLAFRLKAFRLITINEAWLSLRPFLVK